MRLVGSAPNAFTRSPGGGFVIEYVVAMRRAGLESTYEWNELHELLGSQPICKAILELSKIFSCASMGMLGPGYSSSGGLPFGQVSWKECVSRDSRGPTLTVS